MPALNREADLLEPLLAITELAKILRNFGVGPNVVGHMGYPSRLDCQDVRGVVIGHPFIARTTFVINREGRIVTVFSSRAGHISPAQHVARALAKVQKLAAH